MCSDLKVLVRVFVNKCRATYCKAFLLAWQGDGANDMGACALCGFDNPLCRLVKHTMIIRFKADTNFLFCHHISLYSMILVTTPAPTVKPPSRMANLEPCSSATGTINSTVRFTLSPGMTISTPSGRVISPVTSIVRM